MPMTRAGWIALGGLAGIVIHLGMRALGGPLQVPLQAVVVLGGGLLLVDLAASLARRDFGADLLAGISIVTAALLGQWLAGALVVLMLSGGATLEAYVRRRASSALDALARRMPSTAHSRTDGRLDDVPLGDVAVGDTLVVLPHEICPVDGVVVEGRGVMDESYLTGEPFMMSKAPGSEVLSGAVNGDTGLTIRAVRPTRDSRYARIMDVMRETEQRRPRLRRLADRLGLWYTPVALVAAGAAWAVSGDVTRFLAVLVTTTPCPLIIAIPVAVLGSVSLAARRAIIVRDPAVLERIDECRTIILDKTGTLTCGAPRLTDVECAPGHDSDDVLRWAASLERYSRHPLAAPIVRAAREARLALEEPALVREVPGEGLAGEVAGHQVRITGRGQVPDAALPVPRGGLECVILIDGSHAATCWFHDESRRETRPFIRHLRPRHAFEKIMLVSGDRESEVRYLAQRVGIEDVHAGQSPEDKVAIVRRETRQAQTLFVGDGINDAPALAAATVGIAFGRNSDVTGEAAGAVVMDASLERLDELFHIGRGMRSIALQSAIGGMALSLAAMGLAAVGLLSPVAGAVVQELIDLAAVLNALRAAIPRSQLSDF